jgi:hypothetical protein
MQNTVGGQGLSHPNIVAVFDSGSEAGMTICSWNAWKRNPQRPHQHRDVAPVTRPTARPASGSPSSSRTRQASPAGGRRLPPGRRARRPRRRLTCLPDVRPQLVSGPPSFRNPVTRAVRWLTRFHGLDGKNTASFGVASVADAPGGGGGGQVVGPAHRRAPGPSRAAVMAA